MKTKILILLVAVFSFSSCTKNVEEDNGIIDNEAVSLSNNSVRGQGEGPDDELESPEHWSWVEYQRTVYYDSNLTSTEIEFIRSYLFNLFNNEHPSLKLQSYKIINNYEQIYYGIHLVHSPTQEHPSGDELDIAIEEIQGVYLH